MRCNTHIELQELSVQLQVRMIEERGVNAPYDLPLTWAVQMLNEIEREPTQVSVSPCI